MTHFSNFFLNARVFLTSNFRKLANDVPYEPQVVRLVTTIVKEQWICADVGANVGKITLLLGNLVGVKGHVYAFEAHPDNATILKANIEQKHRTNVTVENFAVSDGNSDKAWIFPGRDRRSEEWNIVGHDVDGNQTEPELEIPATSLDSYFSSDAPLHFVKIDVEGAEAQVLRGMRRILTNQQPIVLVEFHDEDGWEGRSELFHAGYRMFDLKGHFLDSNKHPKRIYQCVFYPTEASHGKTVP